jgi:hypothetical protein
MLCRQQQRYGFIGDSSIRDWVLRDDFIFVFDFQGQGIAGNNRLRDLENIGHLAGFKAMINVRANPRLELAGLHRVHFAAAVDKGFGDEADFGDVKGLRALNSFSVMVGSPK